jgi:hypothetical protein
MTFYHDTPSNIAYLSTSIPGMSPNVSEAWLRCEGQTIDNPTNPLNILYYGSPGQIGKRGRFAVYGSVHDGLDSAAGLILHSRYYAGVRRALLTHNDLAVARSIEDSPWAGGHYGGGGPGNDGCIVAHLSNFQPVPPPVRVRVRGGKLRHFFIYIPHHGRVTERIVHRTRGFTQPAIRQHIPNDVDGHTLYMISNKRSSYYGKIVAPGTTSVELV